MAQYIIVYMDGEQKNYHNNGLYDIIKYIGTHSKPDKSTLSREAAYRQGKRVINSRLHKWHLTALERLVKSDKKKYSFNYDQNTTKPVWKIHRIKAKRIFRVIRSILNSHNDPDIIALFDQICKEYGFSSGDDATGSPYYGVIKDSELLKAQNYNTIDSHDLLKCAEAIAKFEKYH